jgi:hypothetical protein
MTPSEETRKYLSEIGAKGGKAAKGTPARIQANEAATAASWTPEARAKRQANGRKRFVSLDERSAYLAREKAKGRAKQVTEENYEQGMVEAIQQIDLANQVLKDSKPSWAHGESSVVYDEQERIPEYE